MIQIESISVKIAELVTDGLKSAPKLIRRNRDRLGRRNRVLRKPMSAGWTKMALAEGVAAKTTLSMAFSVANRIDFGKAIL
jgi:hypothetical protein